jgi:hypothetical protein
MWTLTSIFYRELLISQNWDGQPIVKFHRKHNAMHIYRMIPRNKHFDVLCGHERHEKPLQKRPIGVVSKMARYTRKSDFLGIRR